MTTIPIAATELPADKPRDIRYVRDPADQVFRAVARFGGALVLVIMVFVGAFLAQQAVVAINRVGLMRFITTREWQPDIDNFGIAALVVGTAQIAVVALVVAFPTSLGLALFITEIARGGLRRFLQGAIDLMAAVPSLVFGLWGAISLQGYLAPFAQWLATWFGWFPVFSMRIGDPTSPLNDPSIYKASTFMAGVVVSMMVLPIQTSIMVESFSRAPDGEREGAYALGATRWGMIRAVVLPFGQGGMIGGTMLGLGRALGETIAVYLIISPLFEIKFRILEKGGISIASLIALRYSEAGESAMQALMAAGFSLFILTMFVNFAASLIISRSRSGADSEG